MTTRALEQGLSTAFHHYVDHPTVQPDLSREDADALLAGYQEEPALEGYLKDKAVLNLHDKGDKVCAVFQAVVNKLRNEVDIYQKTVTEETGRWNVYKQFFEISPEPPKLAALALLLKQTELDNNVFSEYVQDKMGNAMKVQLNKEDESESAAPCKPKPSAPDQPKGAFDTSNIVDMDDLEPDPEPEIIAVQPPPTPSLWQNISTLFCAYFTFLTNKLISFINWILE